jgi:hypothetical protein
LGEVEFEAKIGVVSGEGVGKKYRKGVAVGVESICDDGLVVEVKSIILYGLDAREPQTLCLEDCVVGRQCAGRVDSACHGGVQRCPLKIYRGRRVLHLDEYYVASTLKGQARKVHTAETRTDLGSKLRMIGQHLFFGDHGEE